MIISNRCRCLFHLRISTRRLRTLCSLLPSGPTRLISSIVHLWLQPGDNSPNPIRNPASSSPILYSSNNTAGSLPVPLTVGQNDFRFGLATTWTSSGFVSQTRANANLAVWILLVKGEHSIRCINSGRVIAFEKPRHCSKPIRGVSSGSGMFL